MTRSTVRLLALMLPTALATVACDSPPYDQSSDDVLARLDALETENADLTARLEAAEEALGTSDGDISDLEADLSLIQGDLDVVEVELAQALDDLDTLMVLLGDRFIDEDLNLDLEGLDCAGIRDAWSALDSAIISTSATVTFSLGAGTVTCTTPLVLQHRDGARIVFEGATATAAGSTLQFNGTDGIIVGEGYTLGMLRGLTIRGNHHTGAIGLAVRDGAFVRTDGTLLLERFGGAGIRVERGGVFLDEDEAGVDVHVVSRDQSDDDAGLRNGTGLEVLDGGIAVLPGVELTGNEAHGVRANQGGIVVIEGADVSSGEAAVRARRGSLVVADGASNITSDINQGVLSRSGSYVSAIGAHVTDSRTGVEAIHDASINIRSATVEGSGGYGVVAHYAGYIYAVDAEVTGNYDDWSSAAGGTANPSSAYISR